MFRILPTVLQAAFLSCPLLAQAELLSSEPSTASSQESPLRFHGRMDSDWTSFAAGGDVVPRSGSFQDGAELRRARLALSGDAYEWLEYKVSFDITSSKAGLRDMWVQADDLPGIGRLRVGHFKEPFGLERQTGGTAQTFLERSTAAALTPNRNIGFAVSDTLWHKQATWAAGIFRETGSNGEAQDSVFGNEIGFTGRVTFLPWYEGSGERLLHLGLSMSRRRPNDGFMNLAEGMQLHQSPLVVDTGLVAADAITLLSFEAATVLGPLSLQGEWLQATAELGGGDNVTFPGFYVMTSYFLTGESRVYKRKEGRFSSISVGTPFQPREEGGGALEVAARLSKLDLDSGVVTGGVLRSASVGLNWYLNDDLKVQLDYEYSELESFGNVQGVAIRVEFLW